VAGARVASRACRRTRSDAGLRRDGLVHRRDGAGSGRAGRAHEDLPVAESLGGSRASGIRRE
jgi:hypothetical protein